MVGFVILLLEFVLSGRFRLFSTTFGIDLAMQLHQLLARTAVVLLLLHPVLYTLPTKPPLPWDWTGQLTLNLTPAATVQKVLATRGMRRHRRREPGHITLETYW